VEESILVAFGQSPMQSATSSAPFICTLAGIKISKNKRAGRGEKKNKNTVLNNVTTNNLKWKPTTEITE
jgi:hypothetical protein